MPAQLRGRRLGTVFIDPPLEPLRQLLQTLLELHLRPVTEHPGRLGDVTEAVANIARPIIAGNIGLEMLLAQHLAQSPGDLENRVRLAAAEIEDLIRGRRAI